ncbi:hypothetical protein B0T16DRAFT_384327 [Cercophora newfieldiana]|uniref:Uncharacterized protein n=1 Tax=Cercophora newfieldiana TaxID=92897 RepID=A0AA39YPM9_9PEZI|nr:hypothetical protein B0T16DRAFT_384327 [Cercophora newfieldiana]
MAIRGRAEADAARSARGAAPDKTETLCPDGIGDGIDQNDQEHVGGERPEHESEQPRFLVAGEVAEQEARRSSWLVAVERTSGSRRGGPQRERGRMSGGDGAAEMERRRAVAEMEPRQRWSGGRDDAEDAELGRNCAVEHKEQGEDGGDRPELG